MAVNKRLIGGAAAAGPLTPSENFKVVTYTGTGSSQSITGVGFQPDFVWIKQRGGTTWHNLQDSTRGSTKHVYSNASNSEDTTADGVTSFDSDGFTLGGGNGFNGSGQSMVAWCWKANGGTTSSNSDGNITSTVQANTDAGFSIVKYTGNGSASTIGHNLSATPEMIILKNLDANVKWRVYHSALGATKYLNLSDSDAAGTASTVWNDTTPTSTVFSVGTDSSVSGSSNQIIAYCFHSVDGFSKFGSYTGNGSSNGPIVETGFEPAFLMIKRTDSTGHWFIHDNKRDLINPRKKYLLADSANVEASDLNGIDFFSNGFQIINDYGHVNASGGTFIYMAFAADPDTEAPTLASSFNIEQWTGSALGTNFSVSGLGFSPNLVWIKCIDTGHHHYIVDTIRGADAVISSSLSNSDPAFTPDEFASFDSDGFTLSPTSGGGRTAYSSDGPYVGWTWKADDNEPTINVETSDADPVSIYKFEDNSNDVRGNNNGTAYNISYSSSGKFNKAAEFNGSNSYIQLSSGDIITSNDFTISMWLTNDNSGSYKEIFSQQSNNDRGIYFGKANNDTNFRLGDGISNIPLSVGTSFDHIVVAVSGSNAKVYKNAVKVYDSNSFSFGTASGNSAGQNSGTKLGNQWGSIYSEFWDGKVDQVRIFNGQQLNQASIENLYNETAAQNDTVNVGTTYNTSLEAVVSANANAGFSIVKWEGTGTQTQIPHGLSAAPEMIISKRLDSTNNWSVYHKDLSLSHTTYPDWLYLNLTSAEQDSVSSANHPYYAAPSSTVIYQNTGTSESTNVSGGDYISYCFHSVSGYSKIGSYTGNGSTNAITGLGFKPDWVMIKRRDSANGWNVFDSVRGAGMVLFPNSSNAEADNTANFVSFDSDGFSLASSGGDTNASGGTYIYWAMAKNVPSNTTLADSFKVVTYTGNGSSQSITGLGFRPDLVWIKQRSGTQVPIWYDSVRGPGNYIFSSGSDAQGYSAATLTSFDSNGFSVGSSNSENQNSQTFVAWAWKAGNTWQSNINGTIPSIVNANTANGFSVVKWTGDGSSSATVGHNLSSKPDMVIVKDLTAAGGWNVAHVGLASNEGISLNLSAAAFTSMGNNGGITYGNLNATTFGFASGAVGVDSVNKNGNEYVAYCWHSVSSYSKFGSYTGTGSNGNAVTTGFQPDFLMVKRSDSTGGWLMFDSARSGSNPIDDRLEANNNQAEQLNSSSKYVDFNSNDFEANGSDSELNASGATYIYMAFKMN